MLCCLDHGSASPRNGVPAAQAQRGALALRRVRGTQPLGRKPKMDDVAVGDGVILALEPKLAGVARAGLAAERHVVLPGDDLGADEAALEIGVDDAGGLRRPRAAR